MHCPQDYLSAYLDVWRCLHSALIHLQKQNARFEAEDLAMGRVKIERGFNLSAAGIGSTVSGYGGKMNGGRTVKISELIKKAMLMKGLTNSANPACHFSNYEHLKKD